MTNYSNRLTAELPDKASPLLPCSWETVQFTQAQVDLYTNSQQRTSTVKITLTLHPEVEVYMDKFGYTTVSFLSNIFGLVGLYLGYCILDCYWLVENMAFFAVRGFQRSTAHILSLWCRE
jgi:hypothetical protein